LALSPSTASILSLVAELTIVVSIYNIQPPTPYLPQKKTQKLKTIKGEKKKESANVTN
jgi:hypothetical protein